MLNLKPRLLENDYLLRYILYEQAFTPAECTKIIQLPGRDVNVINIREGYDISSQVKRKQIEPIPDNDWIIERTKNLVWMANSYYFDFDIAALLYTHVAEYPVGSWFGWHVDISNSGFGTTRKLTSVTFLDPPSHYEGGALKFHASIPVNGFSLEQGSMVIFPSYLSHEVEIVTKGLRHTLITFIHGHAFR